MPIRQRVNIRRRNFTGSARESELPIVPHGSPGQHNLEIGKGQCFHHVSEEGKEIAETLLTPIDSGPLVETMPECQA
jgi:hypothetical protein